MPLPLTLLYGALGALLLTALGLNVTRMRIVLRLANDAPIPPAMFPSWRAHLNAAEWLPMGVVLLGLLEGSGLGSTALHGLGATLLLGRVLHATAALRPSPLVTAGATLTYGVMLAMPIWALLRYAGR